MKRVLVAIVFLGLYAKSTIALDICEDQPDGARLAHSGDCSKFVVCEKQKTALISSCPTGLHFSRQFSECDFKNRANCQLALPLPSGTVNYVADDDSCCSCCNCNCCGCPNVCSNGLTVCQGKPDGSTLPVPGSSTQYYLCNGDCATIESCANGSEYNSTTGECGTNPKCSNGLTVCQGKPDGINLPVAGSSTQYYVCNGGCATIKSCAKGSEYNPTTGQCEPIEECINGLTVCQGKPDGSTLPVPGSSTQYYLCNGDCATIESCANGSEYNSTTGECGTNPKCSNGLTVCQGKPDGINLPVAGSSTQYYVCNGGCATIKSCAKGSEYNPTTGQCEPIKECINGLTVCQGKPDGSTLPVPGSSTQYYVCNGGCATIKSCASGLEYNPTTGKCESNDGPGPSTGPSGTACVSGGKCVGQNDGTLFPDPSSSGYIVCQCECEIARPCPGSLVFNPAVNVCDWPNGVASGNDVPANLTIECSNDSDVCKNQKEGTLFPVEGACNKFYKCNFGCAVEIECPNNLIYDTNGQYCDYPQNVKCSWPYSPPSGPSAGPSGTACSSGGRCVGQREGAFLVSTTSCGKYVVCQCECEVELDCPVGLYFDSVNNVCNYPDQVQCS